MSGPAKATKPQRIAKRQVAKRRGRLGVLVACNACRKRKIACDGCRPVCGTCSDRDLQSCEYDTSHSTETRLDALKREMEALKSENEALKVENEALKVHATHNSHRQIVPKRRRTHELEAGIASTDMLNIPYSTVFGNVADVTTEFWLSEQSIPYPSPLIGLDDFDHEIAARYRYAYPLLEPIDMDRVLSSDHPTFHAPTNTTQMLCDERLLLIDVNYWSAVAIDPALAATLISSFLTTEHDILGFFDADLFITDLVTKNHDHCSPLLVNALLFTACLGCTTYLGGYAMKNAFLAEAERLWMLEGRRATVPTLSALNLLGFGCICDGDGQKGDQYFLHSRVVAEELEIFSNDQHVEQTHSKTSLLARAHAAWGMFAFHTMTSFYFREGVPRSVPSLSIPEGDRQWNCTAPRDTSGVFKMWCELWRILHPIAQAYCNTGPDLFFDLPFQSAEFAYNQLLGLSQLLPACMARDSRCSHQAMVFHMYYHAAILDIFRPFLGKSLRLQSFAARNSSPKAVFSASLDQLKHLAHTYRINYAEATSTFEWNHACFYIASAVIHDRTSDDWRGWFEMCLRSYAVLLKSYGSAWQFICGLIALAVKVRNIPMSEAYRYLNEFGQHREIPRETGCLRVAVDQEKALTNRRVAQMDAVMEDFSSTAFMEECVDLSNVVPCDVGRARYDGDQNVGLEGLDGMENAIDPAVLLA